MKNEDKSRDKDQVVSDPEKHRQGVKELISNASIISRDSYSENEEDEDEDEEDDEINLPEIQAPDSGLLKAKK